MAAPADALVLSLPVTFDRRANDARFAGMPLEAPIERGLQCLMMLTGLESPNPGEFMVATLNNGSAAMGISLLYRSDLPTQKLAAALNENLGANIVYIPDSETLGLILNQPIYAFYCTVGGEVNALAITYEQLLGFAALAEAGEVAGQTMGKTSFFDT